MWWAEGKTKAMQRNVNTPGIQSFDLKQHENELHVLRHFNDLRYYPSCVLYHLHSWIHGASWMWVKHFVQHKNGGRPDHKGGECQ